MFFIICYHFFFPLSLTHSHLPQCWTASNRAWRLKQMSVHSLIIPPSTAVLTVLIQSYRASWNCSIVVSHGTLLCCACFMRVCRVCFLLLSSYFMGLLSIDCAVLQEREIASHSWSVTLSLSLTLPFSLCLFFPHLFTTFFSIAWGDGHSWPDIQAGLCLREPHAAGR